MKRNREVLSCSGLPEVNSIFRGEVASLQPYGIFVKIPGCDKNGLVHISQISKSRVERPEDVVELKEKIYCKVISVESDGQKISLSMKVVNQTTGQDLDPNQLQTSKDEQHRKKDFKKEFPKIELGAVFDTTCKKCGGKGHLAQDCFHIPGGKTYDLIEEVFEWPAKMQGDQSAEHRKHKKESKKHKKKHSRDRSLSRTEHTKKRQDSSSSNSEDDSSSPDLGQESMQQKKALGHKSRPKKEESPARTKHSRSESSSEKHGHRSESGSRKRRKHHSPSSSEKKHK